jgi:hypothetical protein
MMDEHERQDGSSFHCDQPMSEKAPEPRCTKIVGDQFDSTDRCGEPVPCRIHGWIHGEKAPETVQIIDLMAALRRDLDAAKAPEAGVESAEEFGLRVADAVQCWKDFKSIVEARDAAREKRLRDLLTNLVRKLDECTPHIASAFVLSAAHGAVYEGPNYKAELDAARAEVER